MKRPPRKLLIGLVVAIGLGIFVGLTLNFWRRQFRAYMLGRLELAAEDYGVNLPADIDTVEVFTFSDEPGSTDTNGFIGDYSQPLGTTARKTLTGGDAKEVADLWRY